MLNSIYDQKNRWYIDWDIDYKCNYSCNYCIQKKFNVLNKSLSQKNDKIIKSILLFLKNTTYNFTLGLLGGEPTISENFWTILNFYKNKIYPEKKSSEIYISTNFSKSVNFFKKILNYPKVHIWISIHPEYFFKNLKSNLIKIKELLKYYNQANTNNLLIISPMFDINYLKTNFEDYLEIFKFYEENKCSNFIYHPQILYIDKKFENNNFKEIQDFLIQKDLEKILYSNIKEFYIPENNKYFEFNKIFTSSLYENINSNNFKCYYNYLYFNPYGDYNLDCLNKSGNILNIHDYKFLIEYKLKFITCNKLCTDFPKLLSPKIKN